MAMSQHVLHYEADSKENALMAGHLGFCALCLQTKQLRDSHLLPAGVLRLLRDDSLKNPNPFVMSLDYVGQTSCQAKQYLLCQDCEQRLSREGENWTIKHCYHESDRSFPLRDLLKGETPILSRAERVCIRRLKDRGH